MEGIDVTDYKMGITGRSYKVQFNVENICFGVLRMEEAISRLTLALEELEEKRREEDMQRSDGENWKKIARTIDRCTKKDLLAMF